MKPAVFASTKAPDAQNISANLLRSAAQAHQNEAPRTADAENLTIFIGKLENIYRGGQRADQSHRPSRLF